MGKILVLCMAFFPSLLLGQNVRLQLDQEKLVLGEQTTLTVSMVNVEPGQQVERWFNLDTPSHVEVIKKSGIDTANVNGKFTYIQKWTITSFDSGRWALKLLPAIVRKGFNGAPQTIAQTGDSVYLSVLPVNVENLKDYHDIHDIEQVRYFDPLWILVGLGIIVLAVAIVLLVRYLKRRSKKPKPVGPAAFFKGTALDWALQEIEKLQKQNLPDYPFFSQLDKISRDYFDKQLALHTLHSTIGEVMVYLQPYLPDTESRTRYFQVLQMMNIVKFAKYQLPAGMRDEAVKTTLASLKAIDRNAEQMKHK